MKKNHPQPRILFLIFFLSIFFLTHVFNKLFFFVFTSLIDWFQDGQQYSQWFRNMHDEWRSICGIVGPNFSSILFSLTKNKKQNRTNDF